MKDILADVVLHHEKIDWTNPDLTPDAISSILLGHPDKKPPSYWFDPDFEGMEPHEIEREILLDAGRSEWGGTSFYDKPYYLHFLMLMKLMFPSTDITPTLADAVLFFCNGISSGYKILNLIGSQNSSKSASASRIGFVCMFIDPHHSVVYVANPFDNSADSTVWGDVEELWSDLKDSHPIEGKDGCNLFPDAILYAGNNRRLELIPNKPKAGRFELKNVKKIGKYKGQKTQNKNKGRGVMLTILDEVNEIENFSFLGIITNNASQDGYFAITSQNFKDEEDMGGRLTNPDGSRADKYDREIPTCFDDLEIDVDAFWYSKYLSITLRFDGHRAPNILAGRTIYEYLFKQVDLDRIKGANGEESLDYFSQVRSFPIRGGEINSVLSSSKVNSSRYKDPYFRVSHVHKVVAFCDPAFGGRDKAMWGCAKHVTAMVTDADGVEREEDLIVFDDHLKVIPIVLKQTWNDYWFDRLAQVGVTTAEKREGDPVSPEEQVAINCLEHNKIAGVTPENFGYDFSMRPEIMEAMIFFFGHATKSFDYKGPPEGYELVSVGKDSLECCKNRLTELAFLAADLFLTKQVRGGGFIEKGITQLSRTRVYLAGGKKVIEDKSDYKARWENMSPDARDVLMGIAGMLALRGFRKKGLSTHDAKNSSGGDVFLQVMKMGIGKARTGRRFSYT